MTKYVNNNGVSEMWLNIKNWVTSQLLGYSQTGHTHSASDITSGLSTVATSGSYSDLSNKPTIPSNTNQLTNGAGFITSSGSCNYADSAGSVAWDNVTDKPSFSSNLVQIGYTTQKTGTWTLTGVVPYKPVIFYFSIWNDIGSIALPNNNAAWVVGAKQTSPSSADYNDVTKLWKYLSGDYNKSIVKASALIIPLSSTVSIRINVSDSKGVNLYAYQ